MRKQASGQRIIEYFIIFTLILTAVFSTGIIERMRRNTFDAYFDKAIAQMR